MEESASSPSLTTNGQSGESRRCKHGKTVISRFLSSPFVLLKELHELLGLCLVRPSKERNCGSAHTHNFTQNSQQHIGKDDDQRPHPPQTRGGYASVAPTGNDVVGRGTIVWTPRKPGGLDMSSQPMSSHCAMESGNACRQLEQLAEANLWKIVDDQGQTVGFVGTYCGRHHHHRPSSRD